MIYIIGIGLEGRRGLRPRPLGIIEKAGLIVGGKRHLEEFSGLKTKKLAVAGGLESVAARMEAHLGKRGNKSIAVLATGDPCLFGIADFMVRRFGRKNVSIIPDVSTVQEAFARIKENSNGLKVLSAHGRDCLDALYAEIAANDKVAVFTDAVNSPAAIAVELLKRGVRDRDYTAYVCESLGSKDERITKGTLKTVSKKKSFAPLNILVLIAADKRPVGIDRHKAIGIPDGEFSHSSGMITKEEIRVVSLSKMDVREDSVVWDIGSGCGSVAVEAARIARRGRVYAVEKDAGRRADMVKNKAAFGVDNLVVVAGTAPGCLKGLCAPDVIFIGGGGKGIGQILSHAFKNVKKGGRVVVNAVTVESVSAAFELFKKSGFKSETVLISLSRAKSVGELNLLGANNPVFIMSGTRP